MRIGRKTGRALPGAARIRSIGEAEAAQKLIDQGLLQVVRGPNGWRVVATPQGKTAAKGLRRPVVGSGLQSGVGDSTTK